MTSHSQQLFKISIELFSKTRQFSEKNEGQTRHQWREMYSSEHIHREYNDFFQDGMVRLSPMVTGADTGSPLGHWSWHVKFLWSEGLAREVTLIGGSGRTGTDGPFGQWGWNRVSGSYSQPPQSPRVTCLWGDRPAPVSGRRYMSPRSVRLGPVWMDPLIAMNWQSIRVEGGAQATIKPNTCYPAAELTPRTGGWWIHSTLADMERWSRAVRGGHFWKISQKKFTLNIGVWTEIVVMLPVPTEKCFKGNYVGIYSILIIM